MRIRLASLAVSLALLVPAAPALAQDGNPFDGQLPPSQPTPAPTVEPVEDPDEGRHHVRRDAGAATKQLVEPDQ